jgi:CRP/FNR family cyclic AMP-dependent transcriptional regulator
MAIEGVVKPLAIASASVWLLCFSRHFSFGVNMLIYFTCSLGMVWQTFILRGKYIRSILSFVSGYKSGMLSAIGPAGAMTAQPDLLGSLTTMLATEPADVKEFVAELLAEMNTSDSLRVLTVYYDAAQAPLRATIVALLTKSDNPRLEPFILRCLDDPDSRVVANSIIAASAFQDERMRLRLQRFLTHDEPRIRANAVIAAWKLGANEAGNLALRGMLASDIPRICASALFALGEIRAQEIFFREIDLFFKVRYDMIVADRGVWRQFLLAISKNYSSAALSLLLSLHDLPEAWRHHDCAVALSRLVEHGLGAERCIARLTEANYLQRALLLKALYLQGASISRHDETIVRTMAEHEVAEIYADWCAVAGLGDGSASMTTRLLGYAIHEECIRERLLCCIHCASLLDKSGQVRAIMGRLWHDNAHIRAGAFEVFDNTGALKIHTWILALLDGNDAAAHARVGAESFKMQAPDIEAVLQRYARSPSGWVRTCVGLVRNSLDGEASFMETAIHSGVRALELIVFLKKCPLFAGMKTSELRSVVRITRELSFEAGEDIVREGDIGDALYLMYDGVVAIRKALASGESLELAQLNVFDFFGEMSMFDAEVRSATVMAKTPCLILRIQGNDMIDMLHDNPSIGIEFIRIFVKRLRDANRAIELRPANTGKQ